jgi:queuine tRNA-ribosyltransferase subunit QTRTD1
VLILGPRRFPPVDAPVTNTNKSLAICTSVGFRTMQVDDYVDTAIKLQPDIVLGPSDFVLDPKPSTKRVEKMCDRTTLWMRETLAEKDKALGNGTDLTVFAPILPVPAEQQTWYIDQLVDDFHDRISGLYFHDAHSVVDLPESLNNLPRLAFTNPTGPSELLKQISLGADLFVLPFIGKATDGGIALDIKFPAPPRAENSARQAIGIDAWDNTFSTDVSPLQPSCECYSCQKHHRAYLHHLLSAKEMLAWVLLQIHNHHVLDQFFDGVRTSIKIGTFEEDRAAFEMFYEAELPLAKGQGPRYVTRPMPCCGSNLLMMYRIRGYQTKSMSSGESKKNPKAYNNLDHVAESLENNMAESLEEGDVPDPDVEAGDFEEHGLGGREKA